MTRSPSAARAPSCLLLIALMAGAGCLSTEDSDTEMDAPGYPSLDNPRFRIQHELWVQLPTLAEMEDPIRVVPPPKGGPLFGATLLAIQPGSLPARLGFENGDVVISIAGMPVATAEDAFAAYYSALDDHEITIVLLRDGAEHTLTYDIE